ncbi:MAG: aspartyl/asparaginyl beta-hydroxylase domain-containing protein [Caulobacteraceae bacterium]
MRLPWTFLQLPIAFDPERLAGEIEALGEEVWRPHPNRLPGNSALTLITVDGDPESDALWGPMQPTRHLKACSYLQQVMAEIGATWGRSRLMRLSGQAEVALHVDINYYWADRMRVHVPIVTQPTVQFFCGDDEINMAAGECWIFDTWRRHKVLNDASRARIHLVADTVGGDGLWNLIQAGRRHDEVKAGWSPRRFDGQAGKAELRFETENAPAIMSPWEMSAHIGFLLEDADKTHPAFKTVEQELERLIFVWRAEWAQSATDPAAKARYQALIQRSLHTLAATRADNLLLRNGMPLLVTLQTMVLSMAVRPG